MEVRVDDQELVASLVIEPAGLEKKAKLFPSTSEQPETEAAWRRWWRGELEELLQQEGIQLQLRHAGFEEAVEFAATAHQQLVAGEELDFEPQSFIVVRGLRPLDGDDGSCSWLIPGLEAADPGGGADQFLEYGLVHTVAAGDPLLKVHPPGQGTSGVTVHGQRLLGRHGRPYFVEAGPGVRFEGEERVFYALRAGQVVLQDGQIAIREIKRVDGNLTPASGSIHFQGSVLVTGDVADTMEVEAGGDIEVRGVTGEARLSGQRILSCGGVQGKEKGIVRAQGALAASYIEGGCVLAGEELVVNKGIMHAQVTARSVRVTGQDGVIVGGQVTARRRIKTALAGSRLATRTELHLASAGSGAEQPAIDLTGAEKQYRELWQQFSYARSQEKHGSRVEQQRAAGHANRLRVELLHILAEIAAAGRQGEMTGPLEYGGEIVVDRLARPGTVIMIEDHQLPLAESQPGPVTWRLQDGKLTSC